jgi:nicotinate-nucleotide pyrophosphorylase (carboxylating)
MSASRVDWQAVLSEPPVQTLIAIAIAEDVGDGDVTTRAIFPEPARARARIITRHDTVVAGLPVGELVFRYFDRELDFRAGVEDGTSAAAGSTLCELQGDLRAILTAERCALNFLMRLCGIATAASEAVRAVPAGCKARIYDTRKTLPGWRRLDKAAVRAGGAENHRAGLFDAVLIKDNHVAAAGSVARAVELGRATAKGGMVVEVEIDRLDQLDEALGAKPDIILLDNFTDADLCAAVQRTAGRVPLEASGGVTLARLPALAATGVERISMGALTHTVKPADLSLEIMA